MGWDNPLSNDQWDSYGVLKILFRKIIQISRTALMRLNEQRLQSLAE